MQAHTTTTARYNETKLRKVNYLKTSGGRPVVVAVFFCCFRFFVLRLWTTRFLWPAHFFHRVLPPIFTFQWWTFDLRQMLRFAFLHRFIGGHPIRVPDRTSVAVRFANFNPHFHKDWVTLLLELISLTMSLAVDIRWSKAARPFFRKTGIAKCIRSEEKNALSGYWNWQNEARSLHRVAVDCIAAHRTRG